MAKTKKQIKKLKRRVKALESAVANLIEGRPEAAAEATGA